MVVYIHVHAIHLLQLWFEVYTAVKYIYILLTVNLCDAVLQAPREYEAFEQLQKDLLEGFPQLKLPSLPRKFHLFLKDTDIEERQIAFDCLMKVYTCTCTCTLTAFVIYTGSSLT